MDGDVTHLGKFEGQHDASLLTLRRRAARRPAADQQFEIVAMRARECGSARQLLRTSPGEGGGQGCLGGDRVTSRVHAAVRQVAQAELLATPDLGEGRTGVGSERAHQLGTRHLDAGSTADQLTREAVEGLGGRGARADLAQQCVALLEDVAEAEQVERRPLVELSKNHVEEPPPPLRAGLDQLQVLGPEEHHRAKAEQVAGTAWAAVDGR
jgi:hypothetical protein